MRFDGRRPRTALAFALCCFLPPATPQEAPPRIDRFAEAEIGASLPPGWSLREVRGASRPSTSVVGDPAPPDPSRPDSAPTPPVLRMVAEHAAGQAWLELDEPLPPTGTLRWSWRLESALAGTDLRDPERDDAAARLFVAFGGGGLFGQPRFLFYTWGEAEGVGDLFLSHVSERVAVVVLRGARDPHARWIMEERDPAADFRRAFEREPDEIRAVGLMADTDQLGGRADVLLRWIEWIPSPPPAPPR